MLAIIIIFTCAYQNCMKRGGKKREKIELVGLIFIASFPTSKQSAMDFQAEQGLYSAHLLFAF